MSDDTKRTPADPLEQREGKDVLAKLEQSWQAGQKSQNRLRRGWVLRILNYFNTRRSRQTNDKILQDALQQVGHGVVMSVLHADLRYLGERGYVEVEEPDDTPFAMMTAALTSKGVDLYEGTIDDPGIDFGHD